MFTKESASDEPIAPCCDKWHACFQVCGSTKKICDEIFQNCALSACDAVPDKQAQKQCDDSAKLQNMMLQMGKNDCTRFNGSQRASACQCVKESNAKSARKDAIRRFYKQYAPEALDSGKVKALAEKADSTAKTAGLFLKLVSKYPKCIKTRKHNNYEEMFDGLKHDKKIKDLEEERKTEDDEESENNEHIEL